VAGSKWRHGPHTMNTRDEFRNVSVTRVGDGAATESRPELETVKE